MRADEILTKAAGHIADRAASRDTPEGERSMARTVAAFNAMFGTSLTEVQGWLFMALLKAARASAGGHNPDDYEDGAAYFALAGECAGQEVKILKTTALGTSESAPDTGHSLREIFRKLEAEKLAKKDSANARNSILNETWYGPHFRDEIQPAKFDIFHSERPL